MLYKLTCNLELVSVIEQYYRRLYRAAACGYLGQIVSVPSDSYLGWAIDYF